MAAAFKIKQEKSPLELELARERLDATLLGLVEKAEESPSTSEDEYNKIFSDLIIKKEPSPVSSPAKRPSQRAQRKRRLKDEVTSRSTNSYVMKLFDRAVDLAPFTEQDPLYPICRAWINNQSSHHITPHSSKIEPTCSFHKQNEDVERISDEQNSNDVFQLPPPKTYVSDQRIPSPIPQPEDGTFVVRSDDQNELSKELLMGNHLSRWKAVRQKWKKAAKINEERYRESGILIKSIFERSQLQEENASTDNTTGT